MRIGRGFFRDRILDAGNFRDQLERPRNLTTSATTSWEAGFLPSGVLGTTLSHAALYVIPIGTLPSGGNSSRRIRAASLNCGPWFARRGVSGAGTSVDADDADGAAGADVDAVDAGGGGVDASGTDISGADASDDGGSGLDGSGVDGSGVDGSAAAAPWNGCSPWNRSAIFLSASLISGEVAPGIACCNHSLTVVGLSLCLAIGLRTRMAG